MSCKNNFVNFCQLFIGTVLFVAAFSKGMDLTGTAGTVRDYADVIGINISFHVSGLLAVLLVMSEALLGLFTLTRIFIRRTLLCIIVMELAFAIVTLVASIDGRLDDCGCFGSLLSMNTWQAFLKNILLLILTLYALKKGDMQIPCRQQKSKIALLLMWCVSFAGVNIMEQPFSVNNSNACGSKFSLNEYDVIRDNHNDKVSLCTDSCAVSGENNGDNYVCCIIRDFENEDSSYIEHVLKNLVTIGKRENATVVVLTSSVRSCIPDKFLTTFRILQNDDSELRKICNANIGLMRIKGGIVKNWWQINALHINYFPDRFNSIISNNSLVLTILKTIMWLVYLLAIFVVIFIISTYERVINHDK